MKDFQLQYSPLDRTLVLRSPTGKRIPPVKFASSDHQGGDFEANNTNNVIAAANGEVIRVIKGNTANERNKYYGNVVIVKHPYNDSDGKPQIALTLYAHLDSVDDNIQEGKSINSKTILGQAGKTGNVSGPHLHFEIIDGNSSWIDDEGKSHPSVLSSINAAKGGKSIGVTGTAGRQKDLIIPSLKDLAIRQALFSLESSYPGIILKSISELSKEEKQEIVSKAKAIFSGDYDIKEYLPDNTEQVLDKNIGQVTLDYQGIYDEYSKVGNNLFLGDESISGNAICLIDPNSPSEGDHTWKLTTSTYKKDYILTRINSNNQKDPSGTKLLISPIDQGLDVDGNKITTTENCIIINNFPFDQSFKSVKEDIINNYDEFRNTIPAPFGIRLGYQKDKSKFILNENREEFYPSSQNLFLFNKESIDGLAIAVMAQVDDNNRYSTYRFQTYNKNGLRVNQFEVSDLMNSTVFYPLLTQGKFMVFYPDKQYGSSTGISLFSEAQIFGKNGPTTDKFKAINQNNLPEGNYRSLQSVVNLPNGDFAVINKEIENANTTNSRITGYYGQVFNIDGNPLSNMVEVGKVPELGSNDPYITTPYGGLTFEVKFQGKSAISTSSLGLSSIFIYDKNNMILEPNDSFERLKSRGFLPGGINFEIYPEQCVVQDSSKLPAIEVINVIEDTKTIADNQTVINLAGKPGINLFEIDLKNGKYLIDNFKNNQKDYLDFSSILEEENNARRMLGEEINNNRFLQSSTTSSNPLPIQYEQRNSDATITTPNFPNLGITLRNFRAEDLRKENFITDKIGNVDLKFINLSQKPSKPEVQPKPVEPASKPVESLPVSSTPNNPSPSNFTPNQPTTSTSTPITAEAKAVKITNANHTISFDQMTGLIPLNDIQITPINPGDKFEVKLKLSNTNGRPMADLLITQGEEEINGKKYRSNYDQKTGIWQIVENFDPYDDKHITGTPAKVTADIANSLLKGNAVQASTSFIPRDFAIEVDIKDVTNGKNYQNQINGEYHCLAPEWVDNLLTDQSTIEGKILVLNFKNYLSDPRDRRYIDAEFKLIQAFQKGNVTISDDTILEIKQFNQTAFEIKGNKAGNYTLDFSLEQCNKTIDRHLNLEIANDNNSNNLGAIIGTSIAGTILTVGTILAFKYKDKIKSYFSKKAGDNQKANNANNEIKEENKESEEKEEDIKENSRLSNRKEENKNNDSGIANKSFLMLDDNIRNKPELPSNSPKIMIVNALKSNGGNDNEI